MLKPAAVESPVVLFRIAASATAGPPVEAARPPYRGLRAPPKLSLLVLHFGELGVDDLLLGSCRRPPRRLRRHPRRRRRPCASPAPPRTSSRRASAPPSRAPRSSPRARPCAASFCFSSSSASLTAASILRLLVGADLVAVLGRATSSRCARARRALLRACTISSSLRSSSACASASFTIRWISSSVRPEFALIVILFSLPVALSFADTCRMPLASMSNVTSICGMPRGAGGMPSRLNWPRLLLPRGHVALALQHVDRHRGLVVVGGREHLLRLGRDRRVLLDELGHHAAERLDAERQRRHVEQQHVLDVALAARRPGSRRRPRPPRPG